MSLLIKTADRAKSLDVIFFFVRSNRGDPDEARGNNYRIRRGDEPAVSER